MTTIVPPVVDTRSGRIQGAARQGANVFLGIPFAEAPVGKLRFAAPVPPQPWGGVREATSYGATTDRVAIRDHIMPERVIPGDATLNLNIFAPTSAQGLPVMVWFHGGGFFGGSPANAWYEGASFVRDGIIVVTVDYRLGFDGFGAIEGAPTNRGVRDWLVALEWVRDNIHAFGGDPARVTIAGQSAGAGAVLTLLGMPDAQTLFRAAISLSGAIPDIRPERARATASRIAALAGVNATAAGFASLSEAQVLAAQSQLLKGMDSSAFERITLARRLLEGPLLFGPIVDGELVPRATLDSLQAGTGADKPLLILAADDELTSESTQGMSANLTLMPRLPLLYLFGIRGRAAREYLRGHPDLRLPRLFGQLVTDGLFRLTVLETAAARGPAPTWVARLAWRSPSFGDALHCVDLPFFFDILGAPSVHRLVGTSAPQPIADDLHGAAVRIIKGGSPGWERWTPEHGNTRVLDTKPWTELDGYRNVRPLSRRL